MLRQGTPHMSSKSKSNKSKIAFVVLLILVVLLVIWYVVSMFFLPVTSRKDIEFTFAQSEMCHIRFYLTTFCEETGNCGTDKGPGKEEFLTYLVQERDKYVFASSDHQGYADYFDKVYYFFLPEGIESRLGAIVCVQRVKVLPKEYWLFITYQNGEFSQHSWTEKKFFALVGKDILSQKEPDIYYFHARSPSDVKKMQDQKRLKRKGPATANPTKAP